jgi:hypothetical protein
MQIIIDGYNLLHNSPPYSFLAHQDLEAARRALLTDLAFYGRRRGHKILVVFDGWREGANRESKQVEQGITVIYSRKGEKADEVIRRLVQDFSRELAVVTSDRGIIQTLNPKKVLAVGVEEFQERLQGCRREEVKGEEQGEEPVKAKKGNPRKLPKTQRKKQKQREKI